MNDGFHQAGYLAGLNFGRELMEPGRVWKAIPRKVYPRLAGWCEFDHRAGFGRMAPKDVTSPGTGKTLWKNNFLGDRGRQRPYVTHFACGYVHGVLENLLPHAEDNLQVKATSPTVFKFWLLSVPKKKSRAATKRIKEQRRRKS